MRKRIISVAIILGLIGVSSISSCGGRRPEENTTPVQTSEFVKKVESIDATYKDKTYNFNNEVEFTYDPSFIFRQSDFIVKLKYNDNSEEIINSFEYKIYNSNGNEVINNYVPDRYKISFKYGDLSKNLYFKVSKINIKNATINGIKTNYTYTGSPIYPEFSLVYNNKNLVINEDYEVIYGENISESGSVTIKGINKFEGEKTYNFSISDLTPIVPIFSNIEKEFNGSNMYASIAKSATELDCVGISSINYVVTKEGIIVNEIKDIGTYHVVASYVSADGYKNISNQEFDVIIKKCDINKVSYDKFEHVYTGNELTEVSFNNFNISLNDYSLVYGQDYLINLNNGENIDNINVSNENVKGSFNIVGINNFKSTFDISFDILPQDINQAFIDYIDNNFEYNGSELKLVVNKLIYNDKIIIPDKDYTISYSNNILSGTAKLTIKGINNFNSKVEKEYQINKKSIVFSDITLKNKDLCYTGDDLINEFVLINYDNSLNVSYKYYVLNNDKKEYINSIINPGKYYCDFEFSLKDGLDEFGNKYQDNYSLYYQGPTTFEFNVLKPKANVDFSKDSKVIKDDIFYRYEYLGEEIVPVFEVYSDNVLVDSNLYSYKILKIVDNKFVDEKPIERGQYVIIFESQYYTFFDLDDYKYLYFTIEKNSIDESQIVWPTVNWEIYTNDKYSLNNDGDVLCIANKDEFSFKFNDAYSKIILEMDNYKTVELENKNFKYNYTNNVFKKYKVNNKDLSAYEIMEREYNFGDFVEIEMYDGYYVSLDHKAEVDKLEFYVGIKEDNKISKAFSLDVYTNKIHYQAFQVNFSNVFETFTIDNTDMLEETIFNDILCSSNGTIKLILKEGYVASYSYSNDGVTIYPRILATSNLETTFKDTDSYGYIYIYRSGEKKSFIQIKIIKK